MLAPSAAAAQMQAGSGEAPNPEGPDENWLVHNIVCQCGTCRHNLIECARRTAGTRSRTG